MADQGKRVAVWLTPEQVERAEDYAADRVGGYWSIYYTFSPSSKAHLLQRNEDSDAPDVTLCGRDASGAWNGRFGSEVCEQCNRISERMDRRMWVRDHLPED